MSSENQFKSWLRIGRELTSVLEDYSNNYFYVYVQYMKDDMHSVLILLLHE